MSNPIIDRILQETGVPQLLDVLSERLSPTDLQSLLLEVYRRRAAKVQPAQLLERYEQDRFVRPSDLAPSVMADFDRLAWSLLPEHYVAVELSPICPLGTNAAVATVDQNKVVTTIRNSEVVADATNVLALACASHRRHYLRSNPRSRERVRLCASHRLVRGQAYKTAGSLSHFRLFCLCAAGRDEGSFQFETSSLIEQIAFYLRLLQASTRLDCPTDRLRVAITDLEQGRGEQVLKEHVLEPLRAGYPRVSCELDPARVPGRGYYIGACFHIYATNVAGHEFELIDGGFTNWTQQMLSNAKERLLISGLGTELLCSRFRMTPLAST